MKYVFDKELSAISEMYLKESIRSRGFFHPLPNPIGTNEQENDTKNDFESISRRDNAPKDKNGTC